MGMVYGIPIAFEGLSIRKRVYGPAQRNGTTDQSNPAAESTGYSWKKRGKKPVLTRTIETFYTGKRYVDKTGSVYYLCYHQPGQQVVLS
jgi:hypothetical protein